jgi:hypothetical protein
MGVKAHGRIGVYGEGRDSYPGDTADDPPPPRDTTGVKGLGDTGVWGISERLGWSGVYGQHTGRGGGYGVVGDGRGAHAGVLGRNSHRRGAAGVIGDGSGSGGAGVLGRNTSGYGGQFEGGKAQLKLTPGATVGLPTTGEHTKGEIYMDSEATLFVCTDDGTPGSWKRFTTTPAP